MRHTGEWEVLFGQRWCQEGVRKEKEYDATYSLKLVILASAEKATWERNNGRQQDSKGIGSASHVSGRSQIQKCICGLEEAHELCEYKRPRPCPPGSQRPTWGIRVACIKYVEHIVKYKLTRKEELALGMLDPEHFLEIMRMSDAPVENPG